MSSFLVRLLLACMACFPALPVRSAGTTTEMTLPAEAYAGSRERRYTVYVPDGLRGPVPLVMALHGCRQTHEDVLRDWGLVAAADRYRFILVAPFITSYDGQRNTNCWGFWLDRHRHQGRGEPEDLHRIARAVEARHRIDPRRRYVTGLSSGGAMAVVLSVTHNEYFAAVASASGLPYGESSASVSFSGCPGMASFLPVSRVVAGMRAERDDPYPIPLLVLQNNGDCTVLRPAGRNLRDAQLQLDAATAPPVLTREQDCAPVHGSAHGCRHTLYTVGPQPASRSRVETVFYDGPGNTPYPRDTDHGHYWIGGPSGRDGPWAVQQGPSYPDIIWSFFERHPRGAEGAAHAPVITLNGPNPMRIAPGSVFIDPGASAMDVEDGSVPVQAACRGLDVNRSGTFTCTYSATDSAGQTTTTTRTVQVSDAAACRAITAGPGTHLLHGRAVRGGWFASRALTSGDHRDVGFAWDLAMRQVTLHEGMGGRWFTTPQRSCGR